MNAAGSRLRSALAAAATLGAGFALFLATGQDDPYLSFWPAHSLLAYGEIVNYNGERVEQSSSLLHTLVIAVLSFASGRSLPLTGYWAGVAFGALAVLRAPALAERLLWGRSAWVALLLGSTPAFLYWCFGSLETTLAAWLCLELAILGVDIGARRCRAVGARTLGLSLAYLMVRPEAGLVLCAALAAWIAAIAWRERAGEARLRAAAVAPELAWLAQVALLFLALCLFRVAYFGSAFPQPVAAKVVFDPFWNLVRGAAYFGELLAPPFGLGLAVALLVVAVSCVRAILRGPRRDARLWLWLFVGANCGFVLFAGGDWMPGIRFFAQFAPLAVVALYGAVVGSGLPRRRVRALLALWLAVDGAGVLGLAATRSSGRPLWAFLEKRELLQRHAPGFDWPELANKIHVRDALFFAAISRAVERLLEEKDRVVVMSSQGGMVAYHLARRFYGRIEFVDRHGISTRHFMPLRDELDLASGRIGLHLEYDAFFARLASGGAPAPDLVFDVTDRQRAEVEAGGYRVIHVQTGADVGWLERADSPGYRLLGRDGPLRFRYDISVFQFLAAKPEWAPLFEPRIYDWDSVRRDFQAGSPRGTAAQELR